MRSSTKKWFLWVREKKLELWSEDLWNLERKSGLGMVADDPIPEELFSISF